MAVDRSFAGKVMTELDAMARHGLAEQTGPNSFRITEKGRALLAGPDPDAAIAAIIDGKVV